MKYAANVKNTGQVALPPVRARVLLLLMFAAMVALLLRAIYLQGIHTEFLQQEGNARYGRVVDIIAHRGMIADRAGNPLAISTPVESIWASPPDGEAAPQQVRQLAQILGMDVSDLSKRLQEKREFVYIKRQLSPELAAQAMKLGIPGLAMRHEYRRYYPSGEVTSHILGFTDVDDNGQEGVEFGWQATLGGK